MGKTKSVDNMEYRIPVIKAGKSAFLTVDDMSLSEETLAAVITEGLKACLNARMNSIGPVTKLEGSELADAQAHALRIANENLKALTEGTFRFPGTKAKSTEPREVKSEAMRLARSFVRDQIRAAGLVISHYPPKVITDAATKLVETDPKWIAEAKANLAKAEIAPEARIDLSALGLVPDEAKVKAAAEAKAKRNERAKGLSASKAGKPETRVKGKAARSKPTVDPNVALAAALTGGTAHEAHTTH